MGNVQISSYISHVLVFFVCGIVVLGISVTYNEQIHIGCERYNLTKTVCVFTGCLVVYASRA